MLYEVITLATATRIVTGLVVSEEAIGRTMAAYGPFAATERVITSYSIHYTKLYESLPASARSKSRRMPARAR